MKSKLLVLVCFVLFSCLEINGQLKVNSNGKVGIGTNTPKYGCLEIGKSGINGGLSIYDSLSVTPSLRLYSQGKWGYLNFGGVQKQGLKIKTNGHVDIGVHALGYDYQGLLNLYTDRSNPSCALVAFADFAHDYGDLIKAYVKETDYAFMVRDPLNECKSYIQGDGTIYAKNNYLTASDEAFKDNILEINSGLDKVKNLKGVTYTMKDSDNDVAFQTNMLHDVSSDTSNVNSLIPIEIANAIKAEKKRKKAGFIAQDLEQVFPEAVYTLPDGKKAIAYSEIIPLLVEAIKEQQSQIEALQQSKNKKTRAVEEEINESSDNTSAMDERELAALFSNIPNPFKEETTISYFIPKNVSKASLHIYNLQGKQMKQINLSDRGKGAIVIKGYELNPGMYMYTLITDGKEVDTKKMILTE